MSVQRKKAKNKKNYIKKVEILFFLLPFIVITIFK